MSIFKRLFNREKSGDDYAVEKLDEHERLLAEQQRRLRRLKHLERERDLYERRRREAM